MVKFKDQPAIFWLPSPLQNQAILRISIPHALFFPADTICIPSVAFLFLTQENLNKFQDCRKALLFDDCGSCLGKTPNIDLPF